MPHNPNPKNLHHQPSPFEPQRILQRADAVWSKIKIEKGEVLVVKLGAHMKEYQNEIAEMLHHTFQDHDDKVICYVEGDLEFTKVEMSR